MSQTDALHALTLAMYSHTREAQHASQVTARAQSETFVCRAPVRKNSPREQEAVLRAMRDDLIAYLETREPPTQQLREALSRWQGVRVR